MHKLNLPQVIIVRKAGDVVAPKEQCPVNKANTSQLQVYLITMRPRDNCFIIPGCGKVRNLFKLVKVQTWFMALGRSVAWECPARPGQVAVAIGDEGLEAIVGAS